MMLEVERIEVAYGKAQALFGVSFDVARAEIHCLLGRNGAGKTTTMKSIMGLLPLSAGQIRFDGEAISNLKAHQVAARQLSYVPQGRRLFGEMTVAENLQIGLMARNAKADVRDWVLNLFPRLAERLPQRAETLSGGEQQMLATARALCVQPRLLLLDEPTEGLQPSMIEEIRDTILKLRTDGVGILLVEQRMDAVLAIADRVTIIENGRMIETLTAKELSASPGKLHAHLGV